MPTGFLGVKLQHLKAEKNSNAAYNYDICIDL